MDHSTSPSEGMASADTGALTLAQALDEFEAQNSSRAPEPKKPPRPRGFGPEYVPSPITEADLRRAEVTDILIARRDARLGRPIAHEEGEMSEVWETLEHHVSDETVLAYPVEELADIVEKMAEDATHDGEYDEDGIGHAWFVPRKSFNEAREALRWTPKRNVDRLTRPHCLPPVLRSPSRGRSRRVACANGPPDDRPRSSADDDDPHDDVDPLGAVAA